jgi:hypothetical protein
LQEGASYGQHRQRGNPGRPQPERDPLIRAIAGLKAQAHAAGLTDEIIDEELAAYNAERQIDRP